MNIAENIKKFRKEKNLTQKELASKLGVTSTTIQNYENERRKPDINTLNKIANILGVTINSLAGEKDTITKQRIEQILSSGITIDELSKKTGISIDRLNSFMNNAADVTYDEIKKIGEYFNLNNEELAEWIAWDTFTSVVYNNKCKDEAQAQFLKKFFLNEPITKNDLISVVADDDKEIVNQFYSPVNNINKNNLLNPNTSTTGLKQDIEYFLKQILKNFNLHDLSKKLNISYDEIFNAINSTKKLSLNSLQKIASYFKLTPEEEAFWYANYLSGSNAESFKIVSFYYYLLNELGTQIYNVNDSYIEAGTNLYGRVNIKFIVSQDMSDKKFVADILQNIDKYKKIVMFIYENKLYHPKFDINNLTNEEYYSLYQELTECLDIQIYKIEKLREIGMPKNK